MTRFFAPSSCVTRRNRIVLTFRDLDMYANMKLLLRVFENKSEKKKIYFRFNFLIALFSYHKTERRMFFIEIARKHFLFIASKFHFKMLQNSAKTYLQLHAKINYQFLVQFKYDSIQGQGNFGLYKIPHKLPYLKTKKRVPLKSFQRPF